MSMARAASVTSTSTSTSRVVLSAALALALAARLVMQKQDHELELGTLKDALEVERTARVGYEARVRALERWPWFAFRRTGDLMTTTTKTTSAVGSREKSSDEPSQRMF